MRTVAIAWIALLVALAVFTSQTISSREMSALVQSLSPVQQLMILVIALIAVWIIGAAIWQARALSQIIKRSQALEGRLDNFRQAVSPIEESQRGIEGVVSHLTASAPEDSITSLQKRLSDSENRTAVQEGQNKSADMQERLQDIRERQVAVRERLGEVIAERRALEPTFNELNDRQRKLESSLAEMELDDNRNSLFRRLEDLDKNATRIRERLEAVCPSSDDLRQVAA